MAVADIPKLLREYIKASRAHGRKPPAPSNDVDIAATVERSRSLVQDLKPSEALSVLTARIAEENEAHARRLIPLLKEQAEVQRIVSDHTGRLAILEEIARIGGSDAALWGEIGDIQILLGSSQDALGAYHRARSAAMADQDERNISNSHERIGDVLVAQGDGAEALGAYQASLALRTALAQRDPANTEWQRDLSVSHDRIGDILVAQGDGAGALAAYQASLALRTALAQRDPANTQWQRDLSVSHSKIGDVLVAQGDGAGALAAYQAGQDIARGLAQRDPANTEFQRDLSVSHNKIGDVLVSQGDGAGALAAHQAGLDIARSLAQRDPANTQWQRDLVVSNVNLSKVVKTGKRAYLERALQIVRDLYETNRLAPVDAWMLDDLTRRLNDFPDE